jgi:FkbM family methyltransferase
MIQEYIDQITKFSLINPKTVLEIGALDGEYTKILKEKFNIKNENVYLVEPNLDLLFGLRESFPNSIIIPYAISDKEGICSFNRVVSTKKMKQAGSSLLERIDGWNRNLNYDPIQVEVISGEKLFETIKNEIDLCIVDVEGMAFEVITSFGQQLANIKSLMIECEHKEIFKSQKLYDNIFAFLTDKNFRQMAFKYSYANQSDSIWIQEKYVDLDYKFWPVPEN